MKKVFSLFLTALLFVCLAGCGVDVTPASEPSESTAGESAPDHIHSFAPADCTTPETCSCGETRGTARGHNPSKASCVSRSRCYTCGETLEPALGHDYVDGFCTRCRIEDVNYVPEYITFQDPFLENYVKQALGIAGDQGISTVDIKKLTRLSIKEGVTDLQDLKHAVNLESVLIEANYVKNLDVLKTLPIHTVELGFWTKIDVSFLNGMNSVTKVRFNNCEIAGGTLQDVISSKNLTELFFYATDNSSLAFLADAQGLEKLELYHAFPANGDISVLLELPNLKALEIYTFNSLSAAQNDTLAKLMAKGVLVDVG